MIWPLSIWFGDRREIFAYFDGEKKRRADPMVLLRGVITHKEFNLERHLPEIAEGDLNATDICVRMMREIFDLEEFDDGVGLTERETVDLFWNFVGYLDSLKKSTSEMPTLQQPSDQEFSPPPSEESPTSNSLESPSTSDEPVQDKPLESSVPSVPS